MQATPVEEEVEQITFYLHNHLSFSSVRVHLVRICFPTAASVDSVLIAFLVRCGNATDCNRQNQSKGVFYETVTNATRGGVFDIWSAQCSR